MPDPTPRAPAPAPPKGFRPHMSKQVKLEAALRALGLTPENVDYDHDPPLQLRIWVPEKNDTDPPANDPRYIVPRDREAHRKKTTGGKTKAKATGDTTEIHKTRRLAKSQEQFRRKLLAKEPGAEPGPEKRPKTKWPQRPFNRKNAKEKR